MSQLRKRVDIKEGRARVPFFLYKRVDLRQPLHKISAFFQNNFGGDYLLRRTILRWSNEVIPGEDVQPAPSIFQPYANEYWLNLGQTGTGHAGTEADPWSMLDWQAHINPGTVEDRTIYVWGVGEYNEPTFEWDSIGGYTNYRAYQPEVYGPWRLQLNRAYAWEMHNNPMISGGILWMNDEIQDLACTFASPTTLFNMVIICSVLEWVGGSFNGEYSAGNTLIAPNYINWSGGTLNDSIIHTSMSTGGGFTLNNCEIGVDLDVAVNTYNNCEVVPSAALFNLPDFYSEETEFNYLNFNYFSLPPDPGVNSPTYPYYENGMYGLRRITIGAVSYAGIPTVLPQPFTITLRKKTSVHVYYEDLMPDLISTPATHKGCTSVAAPLPVDDDIFSTLFRNSSRLANKTYNLPVESDAIIEMEFRKLVPSSIIPNFCDVVIEGYFSPDQT